jgi:hypothetical protein
MGKEQTKKRRRGCLIPIVLTAALLFWVPVELHISNNVLKTEEIAVQSGNLPASFDKFRILHLSDLHEKAFGKDNEDLIRKAKNASPDIIAITGDMIDSEEGLAYAGNLLPELTAIAPVYYVTGNHEWAADGKTAYLGSNRLIARLERLVNESGAVWLDSDFLTLERGGESIVIAGLCDQLNMDAPRAAELLRKISDTRSDKPFTLLLSHRHDFYYEGFDVALTGHAHGGVIRLPFTDGLIGPSREWFPKGTSGVISRGGTQVVVSRGLGDTYAPRFLNRPQVLVVRLEAALPTNIFSSD